MRALLAERTSGQAYLIVDIDRSSSGSIKSIERYYVDPLQSAGTYWMKHEVEVDIKDGSYQSCVGRVSKGGVDGIYTAGATGGVPQLLYEPVIDVYGGGSPVPVRLRPPGRETSSAIATARNLNSGSPSYGTTDLYAVSGWSLYRLSADQQMGNADPTLLRTDDVLYGTSTLVAMSHDGTTTVWAKNPSDQVFYVSCPNGDLEKPDSWSAPVPILTGIEHISPYMNRTDAFASGGTRLQKLMQAPSTAGGLWRAQDIHIASDPQKPSLSFNSYTTVVNVTDEHGLPAKDVVLAVSANTRTPVYMNGIYYVLGQTPTRVHTDDMGSVTVVEATEDINATLLTLSIDGATVSRTINPMDKAFAKLAALNSVEKLRDARIPCQTTAGGVVGSGSTPLVAPSTARDDLEAVAMYMNNLQTAYSSLKEAKPTTFASRHHGVVPPTLSLASGKVSSASMFRDIDIAAGDLFRWLKSGVEAVIRVIYDQGSHAWQFMAKIAGKTYSAVLDTVEAIVGAVEWLFNAIKTVIEDLIHFVESRRP